MCAVSKLPGLADIEQRESLAQVKLDLHFFGRDLVIHFPESVIYFPVHFGTRFSKNERIPSSASAVFINSSR